MTARGIEADAAGGDADKYASRKLKFAERVDYSQIHDFIVYIDQPPREKPAPPKEEVQVVTQKDATFKPHVLPVLVGTTVAWPNDDDILHNVFSISAAKEFDLDLYKKPVVKRVTFDKPGRVDVFCSIHKDMHCIIQVLENPQFVTTDSRGRYTLTNVPAGSWRLKAWHDRMPSVTREVTVPASGEVKVDLTLGFGGQGGK
ncbi:MAG TPA: carboxypeptidase regulatory-like domain-containing protein [Candidatus Limnocylindria bacterium]|nr:carboxypeptidase regulatory-like domain-containing protein [Candidatus Limnocylindria bacterium]